MKTLSGRLTVSVVGVVALALAVFSALLFSSIRSTLLAQFDGQLLDEARALANMVEERPANQAWELELSAFAVFEQSEGTEFYELWMDDGAVIARSHSLGSVDLPRDGSPVLMLPNHAKGRRVVATLPPRQDEEAPTEPTGRVLTIAVARDTRALDRQLRQLLWLLLGGGVVTLAAAAAASRFAIRRGLRPVEQLSARIDAIDDTRLASRLEIQGLPTELSPVVDKLNGLLKRLEDSFSRERRFTADVSHELRTPLAGLQSILEVTASRDRGPAEYRSSISDALVVARQMTELVETLLTLVRLESPVAQASLAPTPLRQRVDEAMVAHASVAKARGLSVENRVGAEIALPADPARLQLVLSNLLGNAVEHTSEGGRVVIVSDPAQGIWLEVQNSGPAIPEWALPRLFERFYRADPSRSGTAEHHGLGLSVVRGVCDQLGASVTASNRKDGWVTFTIRK